MDWFCLFFKLCCKQRHLGSCAGPSFFTAGLPPGSLWHWESQGPWRPRMEEPNLFWNKKSWNLGWHVCILDNFGLIQMIQMNSCSMLTSGVRYPHFLSCISPNLTNDRNPRPLIFPCSLLAVIHVSSRRFHYSQCTTSGLDDRIFPSESGAIPLVVEGQTSGFLFDSESYPTTCPWIWRFGTCADECR